MTISNTDTASALAANLKPYLLTIRGRAHAVTIGLKLGTIELWTPRKEEAETSVWVFCASWQMNTLKTEERFSCNVFSPHFQMAGQEEAFFCNVR
jgi:hypothetical protein